MMRLRFALHFARLGLLLFIPKKSQKGLHDVLALLGNYPHGYSLHNSRYSDYDAEWMDFLMFGIIGTVGVIAQMALLAFGAPIHAALLFGLGAAVCWIFHALERSDKALLVTNLVVGTFAFYGLLP